LKIDLHEKVYAKFFRSLSNPSVLVNGTLGELEKRFENDNP
jgi:hypothetical protein